MKNLKLVAVVGVIAAVVVLSVVGFTATQNQLVRREVVTVTERVTVTQSPAVPVTVTTPVVVTVTVTPTPTPTPTPRPTPTPTPTPTPSPTPTPTVTIGPTSITGGGATFVNPQMQLWIRRFMEVTGGRTSVNYQSIGSGAGEAKWLEGALDFGVSDIGISKAGYQKLVDGRRRFIQIPIIAGSVAVIYNIPEFARAGCELRLSGELVADIYLGKIIKWNDPRIAELQDSKCRTYLPDKEIYGVHRSDGSGTTALFTMYLTLISKEWAEKISYGYTVTWPRDQMGLGEGARGNEGVSAKVLNTPHSIGYVEAAYAIQQKIPVAFVRNREGRFVKPDATTVSEALKRAAVDLPGPQEFWGDLPLKYYMNREGENTYPIVGTPVAFMYLDAPRELRLALYEFFRWVLTEGQKAENIVEGFIPIPEALRVKALQYLEALIST